MEKVIVFPSAGPFLLHNVMQSLAGQPVVTSPRVPSPGMCPQRPGLVSDGELGTGPEIPAASLQGLGLNVHI